MQSAAAPRSLAFSLVLFSGVSLKSICYEANWVSPDIFVTFYRLDVTVHSMAQAVPSAGSHGGQPPSQSENINRQRVAGLHAGC